MLKPPRVGGAAQLRLFVEELGFDWACQVLDVHPATMRGWLRGAHRVPPAAMQALYWLTSYGFSEACSEAHWSHQYLLFKVRELEGRLARMRMLSGLDAVQTLEARGVVPLGGLEPGQARIDLQQQAHHGHQQQIQPGQYLGHV